LTAWTSEKGIQALRASLTLGRHYHRVLALNPDAKLIEQLRRQLADAHTPSLLRLELARVLYTQRELPADLLRQLMDSSNPSPLRLIAAEALMEQGHSAEATAALHELGRMPNREIALGIAQVAQRRLGVNLGLPRDKPLPPLHSSEAVKVARNVFVWASNQGTLPEPVLSEESSESVRFD
jgi:hypothetical protein